MEENFEVFKYEAIFGIAPGYNNNVSNDFDVVKYFSEIWSRQAKRCFDETGVYISAVISECNVVYNVDWGCPEGGERCVKIECCPNPAFMESREDVVKYQDALYSIILRVKKELKQETVSMQKIPVSNYYYYKKDGGLFIW